MRNKDKIAREDLLKMHDNDDDGDDDDDDDDDVVDDVDQKC